MRRARVIANDEVREGCEGISADGAGAGALHLKSMIARLPNKQRQALVMRKFGGLDYDEIASALGCSEEAARAGVYQAMKKIKAAE
jgi:DNA-directed RNA polymerase specialized sigma24 family protein